jgi:hypothetical protein
MLDERVRLKLAELGDVNAVRRAYSRQIIAHEIDDHNVLRAVFLARRKLVSRVEIGHGMVGAAAGAFDGARFDLLVADSEKTFGRGAADLVVA